jgi:hypothetical protein
MDHFVLYSLIFENVESLIEKDTLIDPKIMEKYKDKITITQDDTKIKVIVYPPESKDGVIAFYGTPSEYLNGIIFRV